MQVFSALSSAPDPSLLEGIMLSLSLETDVGQWGEPDRRNFVYKWQLR